MDPNSDAPASTEGAAATPERPAWLADDPHGFWDGEKGEVKVETLYKSFDDTKRLIGARVGDLGIEARRKLAEVVPDAIKGTWAEEYRAQLAADDEFLGPLEEAWKAKNLKQAPEAYEAPAIEGLHPENPLYGKATELAKKYGFDQESFGEFMTFVGEAQADATRALSGATEDEWKAAIPDLERRANAVHNRLKALAPDHAQELMENLRSPNAMLAVEALVKATTSKPLALEGVTAPETLDKKTLDQMVLDQRYYSDPEFHAKVTKGFERLYREHV